MSNPLRVLIVEDSEDDALLVLRLLRRSGYEPVSERVESEAAMRKALAEKRWDVILSDYVIPGFGGLEALKIAKECAFDLPFIMLSNKVSEETLVEAVRAGAGDFITKDHLERLGPVMKRNLADAPSRAGMRRAEIEWRAAFDSVQDAIFIHDAEFRIVRANLPYAALARMPIQDVIGKPYWEVFPKAEGPLPGCRYVCAGKIGPAEEEVRLPTGEVFSSRSFPIADAAGRSRHYLHVMQNTTERDRVREALENSEKRFRGLIKHASDLMAVVDADGTIAYISPSVRQMGGYEVDELEGRNYLEFTHPEDRAAATAGFSELIRDPGVVHKTEFRFRRKDGAWIMLESVATNALADPLINGIVMNSRDVTERKRSEVALHKVNRALKVLSAGNMEVVRATNETSLLEKVCRAAVEVGGYLIAWVGYPTQDAGKTVLPQAAAGIGIDVLRSQYMTWDDREGGGGPSSRALRTGQTQVVQDISRDPGFDPWRELALAQRIASAISLPLHFNGQELGVLSIYAAESNAFDDEEVRLLKEMAGDVAFGIRGLRIREQRDRAMEQNQRSLDRLGAVLEGTIRAVALTVEKRDPYTAGHQRRVAELAVAIGQELGLPGERIEGLRLGATIHDIGKIYVPAEILARPGRLSPPEMEIIKTHTSVGFEIVQGIDFPWPIAQMILQHHERLDGSGYPQGLKGEQIILESRILGVADVVEAMSSHRPYRPGLGLDVALAQGRKEAGSKLDTEVVAACERLFRDKGFRLPV
jgi:PAS domain S-box-containing protein/putative nucleotidyltransferase with HDIG domain